jgi:protein-tyrosine phosphatase
VSSDGDALAAKVYQIPIGDFGIPSVAELSHLCRIFHRAALDEQPIVVHCSAGMGRTGIVCTY